MTINTAGIDWRIDPREWRQHHFGMPDDRWLSIAQQRFWLTGAGTGFGRALSIALLASGAHVALSGRREAKLLESLDEAVDLGIRCDRGLVIPADVTSQDSLARAGAVIGEHFGGLDGLVVSAAVPQTPMPDPLNRLPLAQWEKILRSNVTGPLLTARAALPLLDGPVVRMVFLSSEAGWANTPGMGAYNVSKAGLNALTMSLATEVAATRPNQDAQINGIIPGEARSEMNRGSTVSPYSLAPMALALLSHPPSGPNGRFFHRDGRHFTFAYAKPHPASIL